MARVEADDATASYHLLDRLGSVVGIEDANATLLGQGSYLAFGTGSGPNAGPSAGTAYGFAGYRFDAETGLYHAGARAYDPRLGRWLQPDPIRQQGGVNLYAYVGTEQIGRYAFNLRNVRYGYGNPLYSNAGCDIELSPLACVANTSGIVQGTLGGWMRFLKGGYGTLQAGAQYSYTRRSLFAGIGGSPVTDDNMVFLSLRYLPFQ